jgi:hypothetical protein
MKTQLRVLALAVGCWLALSGTAFAQEGQEAQEGQQAPPSAEALAKAAQNPLAALVTLPLQANYNTGAGPYGRTLFNLNVQPVVPITGDEWNLIVRTIIPVNSVPQGEIDSTFGIGDSTMQLFFSPAGGGAVTWGVGPVLGLPTASNPEALGSGKLGLGPSGVVFIQAGKWTMGGVVSNTWSVAGDDDRDDYNRFLLQYFVNFNFGGGWALGTAPIVTANWKADDGNKWTVPWGLQISKITRIGSQPVNLLLGYYANSKHPEGGADAQVRVQINFMFPTGT